MVVVVVIGGLKDSWCGVWEWFLVTAVVLR